MKNTIQSFKYDIKAKSLQLILGGHSMQWLLIRPANGQPKVFVHKSQSLSEIMSEKLLSFYNDVIKFDTGKLEQIDRDKDGKFYIELNNIKFYMRPFNSNDCDFENSNESHIDLETIIEIKQTIKSFWSFMFDRIKSV